MQPQKYPFPWADPQTPLTASSLDLSDLWCQTASGSDLPFFHNALDRQADRPTDRSQESLTVIGRCAPRVMRPNNISKHQTTVVCYKFRTPNTSDNVQCTSKQRQYLKLHFQQHPWISEVSMRFFNREHRQFGCQEAWNITVQHAVFMTISQVVTRYNFTRAKTIISTKHLWRNNRKASLQNR